jgi:hypothetical protein
LNNYLNFESGVREAKQGRTELEQEKDGKSRREDTPKVKKFPTFSNHRSCRETAKCKCGTNKCSHQYATKVFRKKLVLKESRSK